jgi:hypothetical protein
MRLALIAQLLAAAPAPGGSPRVAGPKVLGPEAPAIAYSSIPLAGLVPLSAAEVGTVLKARRSYPEHSRVPVWHQRNGFSRAISFRPGRKAGTGKATDANCEPSACTGTYTISGNVVTIDFKPRGGVMRLTFYKSTEGVAMMFDDWGPKDGRVSPY